MKTLSGTGRTGRARALGRAWPISVFGLALLAVMVLAAPAEAVSVIKHVQWLKAYQEALQELEACEEDVEAKKDALEEAYDNSIYKKRDEALNNDDDVSGADYDYNEALICLANPKRDIETPRAELQGGKNIVTKAPARPTAKSDGKASGQSHGGKDHGWTEDKVKQGEKDLLQLGARWDALDRADKDFRRRFGMRR